MFFSTFWSMFYGFCPKEAGRLNRQIRSSCCLKWSLSSVTKWLSRRHIVRNRPFYKMIRPAKNTPATKWHGSVLQNATFFSFKCLWNRDMGDPILQQKWAQGYMLQIATCHWCCLQPQNLSSLSHSPIGFAEILHFWHRSMSWVNPGLYRLKLADYPTDEVGDTSGRPKSHHAPESYTTRWITKVTSGITNSHLFNAKKHERS